MAFIGFSAIGSPKAFPEWDVGLALGIGGLIGGYLGARLQPYLPERVLRRGLGLVAITIGLAYGAVAISAMA